MKRNLFLVRSGVLTIIVLITLPFHAQVKPGIEVLAGEQFRILEGKRVGLVTNPTGVDSRLRSTVDILNENVELVALFGPEHGVRGDFTAGEHVEDQTDPVTGIPVYSLYGSHRRPTPEMLSGIDVIVYDIQDAGVRSYTYISTLGLVMEAAADMGIGVVVLDRPNPLGGERVEGPLVEEGFHSFVSAYSIPYLYGLTCGELALMLNGEGMLEGGRKCLLKVVPMEGWEREMTFGMTGLPWVPTSPHVPSAGSAMAMAATGIIGELDPAMVGIGYTLPFRVLATEQTGAHRLAEAMNRLGLHGVLFRPLFFKPYYSAGQGVAMQGMQLHWTDPAAVRLTEIQFWFLQEARRIDPSFDPFEGRESRYRMFDQVCGSDSIRLSLMEDFDFNRLKDYWRKDEEMFRSRSKAYYLYD